MIRHIAAAVLFAALIIFAGCTPTRAITYDVRDIGAAGKISGTYQGTKDAVLDIENFEDIRESVPENFGHFVRSRETTIDDSDYCINAEAHYKLATVPSQIAVVAADHMKRRGGFKSVVTQQREKSDYYVTGKLRRLYGSQRVSESAKVGAQFGLIGAIATAGAKTNGSVVIEFSDVAVHRRSDGATTSIGTITEQFTGELSADAYCWAIYDHVNEYLKSAVSSLAVEIEKSVAGMQSRK